MPQRKAAGSRQHYPRRVAMWAANNKAIEAVLHKLLGAYILPQCVLNAGHRAFLFNIYLAGFWSCFGSFLISISLFFFSE
jgi:hypothetical protein